jgi:ComF family protein
MKFIHKLFNSIIKIIFPNTCLLCNQIISEKNFLCKKDFKQLKFIVDPKCRICSEPFDKNQIENGKNIICATCTKEKPAFKEVLTIFYYNAAIKKIISNFKYYDQSYLADKLGLLLYNKSRQYLPIIDLITIVPLHKKRLSKRKYNQTALLARAMIKHAKKDLLKKDYLCLIKKFIPDLLIKNKNTKSQALLKRNERKQNLANSFVINPKYLNLLKNKKILLIDDVITTGATLQKCTLKLKQEKAEEIIILTLAKSSKEKFFN